MTLFSNGQSPSQIEQLEDYINLANIMPFSISRISFSLREVRQLHAKDNAVGRRDYGSKPAPSLQDAHQ